MGKFFHHFYLFVLLIGVVLLFGCSQFNNLELPESVSVKTDAAFNAQLGTASYDFSSTFNKDTIKNSMGSSASLYDYQLSSTDDTLAYLVRYPIYDVPIDVGSYLDALNIDDTFNKGTGGLAFTQKITLPTIAISQSKTIDIPDVSSTILGSMNSTLAKGDCTWSNIPEPGSGTSHSAVDYLKDENGNAHNSITIEGSLANFITYTDGSAVIIKLTRGDANALSSDYSFMLTAAITSSDGNTTYASAAPVEVRDGGTVTLSFGGIKLPKQLKVMLSGTLANGTSEVSHSYAVKMNLSAATAVDKIEGITATASELGITLPTLDQNVDLSDMVGYFSTTTIGTGSISIKAKMPSTWTGITCGAPLKFSGAGMEENTLVDGTVDGTTYLINKYLNLADKTLAPTTGNSTLAVSGDLSLALSGAAITFVNGSSAQTISVAVECSVDTLSSATIDFSSSKYAAVPQSSSVPTDGSSGSIALPSEFVQHVKEIDFGSAATHYKHDSDGTATSAVCGGFGLKCKVVNSFPAGNDIGITLKSDIFSYSLGTYIAGTGSISSTEKDWVNYQNATFTYATGTDYYLDFSFTLPSTQNLSNLTLGSTYTFGISDVSFVHDWDYIKFTLGDNAISEEADLSSFDLKSIVGQLPLDEADIKKIHIAELPLYFYAQCPTNSTLTDVLGTIALSGNLSASYKDSSSTEHTDWILGTNSSSYETVPLVNPITWPTDSSTVITNSSEVATHLHYTASDKTGCSLYNDFSSIINQYPEDLKLSYNMKMTGGKSGDITVYSTTIDDVKKSGADTSVTVSIDMVAVLKIKLNIVD